MRARRVGHAWTLLAVAAAGLGGLLALGGCPSAPAESPPVFNNPSDRTNGGATYVGSAACSACHPDKAALVAPHGHGQALKATLGEAPQYPGASPRAGVPNPPAGFAWANISYVIGGYLKGANFVDLGGFVLTDGTAGTQTQWNLTLGINGTTAGFAPYLPAQTTAQPYTFDCFRCHTTGAQPLNPANPLHQENRPGIQGMWAEAGARCEACHGPGSHHIPDPQARRMFVDGTNATCAQCHLDGTDPNIIAVRDGMVSPYSQVAELRASGGHSSFACGVCHDPHASTEFDPNNGVRNHCLDCHPDQNLAFHEGKVYQRGAYVEPVTCQSCHMPLGGRVVSGADPAVVGPTARIGDVRSHIFRVDTTHLTAADIIRADGASVTGVSLLKDADGQAALTMDFVCMRCHNDSGVIFALTPDGARSIADGIHQRN